MDINVSQVLAFQRCELDWYYQYVMKRVRRGWSLPFKIGEWWHSLMEHYFRAFANPEDPNPISTALVLSTEDMISMKLDAQEQGFDEQAADFAKECIKLQELFGKHWSLKFPPSKILAIEQPLRRRLPSATDKDSPHFLIGIPDTLVVCNNHRWHLQHKTASATTSMPLFIQIAQRSLHELAYAWLCETIDGPPYAGTYMSIARKLSDKGIRERPESAFVQELIPLDPRQIHAAIHDISGIADRMNEIACGNLIPIDNREADTNRFGNVLSPYFNVKLGIESLRDDTFTDFISRYEEGTMRKETEQHARP